MRGPAEVLGQALDVDIFEQLLQVLGAVNLDLGLRPRAKHGLDDRKYHLEYVRRVDDHHLSHDLGVVVLIKTNPSQGKEGVGSSFSHPLLIVRRE